MERPGQLFFDECIAAAHSSLQSQISLVRAFLMNWLGLWGLACPLRGLFQCWGILACLTAGMGWITAVGRQPDSPRSGTSGVKLWSEAVVELSCLGLVPRFKVSPAFPVQASLADDCAIPKRGVSQKAQTKTTAPQDPSPDAPNLCSQA